MKVFQYAESPMLRFLPALLLLLTLLLNAGLVPSPSYAAETAPADQVFPDSTKGFVSIRNLTEFLDLWKQTQFGKFANDPLMADFNADLQKQLSRRFERIFAIPLEAVTSLPSGEVACGMIAVPNTKPGHVLTMDVTGKRKAADDYLADLSKKLIASGVKQTFERYKNQKITVLTFPPPDAPAAAGAAKGKEKEKTTVPDVVVRRVYYMFRQDTLIVADQYHLIKLIADRVVDPDAGKSLADVHDYQFTQKRCTDDLPSGAKPALTWYVEPLNYGEALRVLFQQNIPPRRKNKPSIFTVLKEQGFDAVRGVGGVVNLKAEGMETIFRTFVYTKKPYRLAMQMLEFPDQKDLAPPDWVPADTARSTSFCVDPQKIFDNFGPMFDAVVMQGENGVWNDILNGLEKDQHGPRINLREELVAHLGNRVIGMSHYDKPITAKSEHAVIAVELKPEGYEPMKKALDKLFKDDDEMTFTVHNKHTIWSRKPKDTIEPLPITTRLVDTPSSPKKPEPAVVEPDAPPAFPDGGVVVTPNWVIVSSEKDYLNVILDRLDAATKEGAFKNEKGYKVVEQTYAALGVAGKARFVQFFARSDDTIRPTYEMFRKGRLPESQAIFGKVLNFIFVSEDEAGRKQAVDGTALPPFENVQKYFGVLTHYGKTENDGYFFKGFSLEKTKTE